jgi:hypothetical protein
VVLEHGSFKKQCRESLSSSTDMATVFFAQFVGGPHDADGDFTAIGNQYLGKIHA